jgi:diketogulonate reductase-like aldo/keto reductase
LERCGGGRAECRAGGMYAVSGRFVCPPIFSLFYILPRNCEYIDLYLIHWPVPGFHIDAYRELIQLKKEGLVRDIGVSNYTIENIQELVDAGVTDLPVVNQFEINPFLNRRTTIEFMRSRGIHPMSYRGLGVAKRLDEPVIVEFAKELEVTPAQLLGRWLVQQGICHIPKSMNQIRIIENACVFGFEIPQLIMDRMNNLTTKESLETFREHYIQRITRDTDIPVPIQLVFTLD